MLFIHGMGHFHPDNRIDNQFLESLDLGVTDDWIVDRTGIQTRGTVLPLSYIAETRNRDPREADGVSMYSNADTGYHAALMALRNAGLQPSDIGMVVAGGNAPRMSAPAEACIVAERLGISAPAVDINSACSTFAVQLRMLAQMDAESLPDFILVVNPENVTRTVDYSDASVAVLVGDATSAAVVSRRVPARAVVTKTCHESDPSGWRKVQIPAGGHFWQDGKAVQRFAITRTISTIQRLREGTQGSPFFIGHQANLLMLEAACAHAGVPLERHFSNVAQRGNCGAAGAPSVLSEYWSRFGAGDELIMAVVGAGLTWAGLLINFTEDAEETIS